VAYAILLTIGLVSGAVSGLFGIGGALIMIPALTILVGFNQTMAQGTSLFVLIFPLTLLPVLNYYKTGNVSVKAGIFIIIGFLISSYFTSRYAVSIAPENLKKAFGVFLLIISLVIIFKQ